MSSHVEPLPRPASLPALSQWDRPAGRAAPQGRPGCAAVAGTGRHNRNSLTAGNDRSRWTPGAGYNGGVPRRGPGWPSTSAAPPPASHPYWARLHDALTPRKSSSRSSSPRRSGSGLGLYGGLRPSYSVAEAAAWRWGGGGVSAGLFVLAVLVLWLDGSRHTPRRERWGAALIGGVAVSAALFGIVFMAALLALVWYAACSGQGPWVGMVSGPAWAGAGRPDRGRRRRRWPSGSAAAPGGSGCEAAASRP